MATIRKPVKSITVGSRIQVFAHHDTLSAMPDAATWAAGDIIDVIGSLGKPANKCKVIMRGNIEITIKLNNNTRIQVPSRNENETPSTIEDIESGTENIRLFNSSGTQIFDFDGFGITNIHIVAVGAPTTSSFIEIIVCS